MPMGSITYTNKFFWIQDFQRPSTAYHRIPRGLSGLEPNSVWDVSTDTNKKISASAGRLHLSPRKLHLSNSGRLGPSSLDTDRHGSRTIQLSKQPVYLPQEQGWKTLHSLFHLPMESSVIAGRYQQSLFIRPPYRSIHNLSGAATSEPFRNHTHGCFKRGKASVLQQMGRHLCYRLADRKNEWSPF